jgi:hypothetical protein
MGTLLYAFIGHLIVIFGYFSKNLELIIQIIQFRNKKLLACVDWNLKFMLDNTKVQEVQNLSDYDIIHAVRYPKRITSSTESLIDVIIINKATPE